MNSPEELRRLYWTIALVISCPLLTVLLIEAEQAQRRKGSAYQAVLKYLRVLFLPFFALWLAFTQIMGYSVEADFPKLFATLAGVSGIIVGLSLINAILFSNVATDSWQARTPKLLVDMVRLFLVVIGGAIVLSLVWGVDLGQLAAALGIGSIVIGLAIAEPLGNVFAGLMLLIERPIAVGDWIKIGDQVGQVIEINWRAIHLRTFMRELVVVPNAILAKESFSNFSRPTRLHCETITLGFSYDDPPNKVRAVLLDLLETTPGILQDPPTSVRVVNYADFSIEYRVIFFVEDFVSLGVIRDAFMTKVWYAAKREGISIPFPTAVEYSGEEKTSILEESGKPPLSATIASHPALLALPDNLKKRIEEGSFWKSYARDEIIVEQGNTVPGLFLIVNGRARSAHIGLNGPPIPIFEAGPGEVLGESIADGNRELSARITAIEDLDAIVIPHEIIQSVLIASPRFAREISSVAELRHSGNTRPSTGSFLNDLLLKQTATAKP